MPIAPSNLTHWFREAQIGRILQEVEMGAKAGETCRKHGISEPTYYKWMALMHQPQAVGTDSPYSWLPAGQARPSGARCRGIMVAGEG